MVTLKSCNLIGYSRIPVRAQLYVHQTRFLLRLKVEASETIKPSGLEVICTTFLLFINNKTDLKMKNIVQARENRKKLYTLYKAY